MENCDDEKWRNETENANKKSAEAAEKDCLG